MYNTKTATVNNEEFNSSYMPVGINKEITLKEVNVKKSPTNKDFIELVFENNQGQTATMSEWKNEKNMWIKTDEDLQNRDNQQFGRLLQIIKCYYPMVEDVELNSFLEMINWVKSKLDPMIATKKQLRLKVIYDNRGYTKVSTYGVFVEPNDVPEDESNIRLFKRDLLERPIVADDENKAADPLASVKESTPVVDASDDLPF